MSVDRLSISNSIQVLSSPDPLLKATPVGSTAWDIENEAASLLFPAPPSQKRSVMVEIRNRPWNDSPTSGFAGPDDSHDKLAPSPRSKFLATKSDNLVMAKSSSPSLGPSQSASQHGRYFPLTDGTLHQADARSKYFISQAPQMEQHASLEKQPVVAVLVFSSPEQAENPPTCHLDVIGHQNQLEEQDDTFNPSRVLDNEVTQYSLVPRNHPDPATASCLQASPTEQPAFWQPEFDVDVEDASPDDCVDSELIDYGSPAGWDFRHSVDYLSHATHLWPSVNYAGGLYSLAHDGYDTLGDLASCHSGAAYGAREHSLYHEYPQEPNLSAVIPEYDLSGNLEVDHLGGCMMDPTLIFSNSDNGEHELVEGHAASCNLSPDSHEDGNCEEAYADGEPEGFEQDDAWDECHSAISDAESHITFWNRGSTTGDDLDNSSLSSFEHPATMFSEGRALLLGSTEKMATAYQTRPRRRLLSLVEADVAKSLRNHWLPQKL